MVPGMDKESISMTRFLIALMRPRQVLCASATLFLIAGTTVLSQEVEKPNFVVIFCDDLGYGDLGCFGHPTIRTPHLDRMAAEGQRWTNFYVGASVCTPSRAALLTGRLPIRNGMMSAKRRVLFPDSKGGLPASETTIAEALKEAGYATAAVGKWHLGHLPQYLPTAHGFDTYWGIPYSNDMDAQKGFPGYRKMAQSDALYVAPIEQYNVPILHNTTEVERPANQHTLTGRYTDKAIEFIKQHREERFFVYLAHNLPHIPLYAGQQHRGTSRRGLFGDVIEEIDAGVGKILATLKQLALDENTLVVFTSDNGPWLPFHTHGGSAGLLREGKGTTFEGGMREPTLFWWPGTVDPGVQIEMGATMDLLPTFCALAGVAPPSDRTLDGYDLSPLLLGETQTSVRDRIFYWREEQLWAVRVGPWKAHFITQGCYGMGPERVEHETPELYQLEHDPSEKYNIAEHHPDVIEQLTAIAQEHRQSVEPIENQLTK
jgi:arylsulfatase A-like enzyme